MRLFCELFLVAVLIWLAGPSHFVVDLIRCAGVERGKRM